MVYYFPWQADVLVKASFSRHDCLFFFSNVCEHHLNGLKQKALSCEVCKIRVHRSCAPKCVQECKWRTIEQVKVVESKSGETHQQHQWLVGNIPVNSKCAACKKACG